jgi:hypothetical protein
LYPISATIIGGDGIFVTILPIATSGIGDIGGDGSVAVGTANKKIFRS